MSCVRVRVTNFYHVVNAVETFGKVKITSGHHLKLCRHQKRCVISLKKAILYENSLQVSYRFQMQKINRIVFGVTKFT